MDASADEIDRQMSSTRDQIDANLDVLERRSASGARRLGVFAAGGLIVGLTITGAAYLFYRKVKKPSFADGVHKMLPGAIADLPAGIKSRMKARPFKLVITDRPQQASSAVGAVIARVMRRRRSGIEAAEPAKE